MTKAEITLRRVKDERNVYRACVPILIAVGMLFIALSVSIIIDGGSLPNPLGPGLIMLSIALRIPSIIRLRDAYTKAADEIEAYLANPTSPISDETEELVERIGGDAKTLIYQAIAYGFTALMLIAAGIFILFIDEEHWLFPVLGTGTVIGGFFMGVLAAKAWFNWRAMRDLERM
ncbi:MAG: hypothetical protein IJH87_02645 [Atopobiaceae bacterium]|nr:hypothetical protein [Atopobiaceae bacterium]